MWWFVIGFFIGVVSFIVARATGRFLAELRERQTRLVNEFDEEDFLPMVDWSQMPSAIVIVELPGEQATRDVQRAVNDLMLDSEHRGYELPDKFKLTLPKLSDDDVR